jgi:hypothetical protein
MTLAFSLKRDVKRSSSEALPFLRLFLGFFEDDVLTEPGRIFLELDLALHLLLVLARPIDLAGLLVSQLDELVLRHDDSSEVVI